MLKNKKIFIITIVVLIVSLLIYFFLPKTKTKCGSVLPMTCQTCKCNMGIPYDPAPFGGNTTKCFMGKLVNCETKTISDK